MVPGEREQARKGPAVLPALRALVVAAELGAHHWRSADGRRRSHARAILEFPADRHHGQGRALSLADRRHTGVDMTTAHTTQHSSLKSRSSSLDLIKWLAMLTMVIDHLRLVWPEMSNLFILGRLSFPLFCVAIAANVARSKPGELLTAANGRYLALMLVFAAISEVPYRYISTSGSFNVLVTLALGLVIAWGWQHRTLLSSAMALMAAAIAYVLDDPLMYGLYGALVPAAVLLAIKRPGALWLLPAVLCR